jgi:hypothetical protein
MPFRQHNVSGTFRCGVVVAGLMSRRGSGVPSSVPVHSYSLHSLGPINDTMAGDDEWAETTTATTTNPADPNERLTNVERNIAALTLKLGQLLSVLPPVPSFD